MIYIKIKDVCIYEQRLIANCGKISICVQLLILNCDRKEQTKSTQQQMSGIQIEWKQKTVDQTMRKNRIFNKQQPLQNIDNNRFDPQASKFSLESNLKSNVYFSIIDNLLLNDLIDRDVRDSNNAQVTRLAYISSNNQVHIDEEALYILQRITSFEIAFVGIYGKKGSGKSLLFDKILNLAGVEGSHYCRTSENYEKGLYFYSAPFWKASGDLNLFLLDCVGFQLGANGESTREEDMLLDLMMILCSSVIVLPGVEDFKGEIFRTIYDRIFESTQRITENKMSTTPEKEYWPKNIYCLLRSQQGVSTNNQGLKRLFSNYSQRQINNALNQKMRSRGVTKQDLVQIQAIPQKNVDGLHIDSQYLKQASRLVRELMQKVYNKKYCELKFNGNIVCKLLLTVIKHLNKKQRIKIDKIYLSILNELYESAYQYHIEFYDQKLQQYFQQDDPFPLDYLIVAFQTCKESVISSFNQLTFNNSVHQEFQEMLLNYIEEKEELILQINKKKTKYHLKTKIKQDIRYPKNLTHNDQIFQFIQSLQSLQQQLDHDRCTVFVNTLINFANDLQDKYLEDAHRKQQIIIDELRKRIDKRKTALQKDKQQNMQNIMLNTQNLNKYQNVLKENQSLDFKIKNTKREIQIEKKFQKQFMANKQATKQHAQHLLAYIRELQEKSRDNQKVIDEINKEFDYNPTIEILNKRIEEKIRQQKQLEIGESQISQKLFKRRSQVRTIISGSNISGVRPPSTNNAK